MLWKAETASERMQSSSFCGLVLDKYQSGCQNIPWSNALESKVEISLHLQYGVSEQ